MERRPDSSFKYMDAISHKYTGKPFPFRSPEGRVALVIELEKSPLQKAAVRTHTAEMKKGAAFHRALISDTSTLVRRLP